MEGGSAARDELLRPQTEQEEWKAELQHGNDGEKGPTARGEVRAAANRHPGTSNQGPDRDERPRDGLDEGLKRKGIEGAGGSDHTSQQTRGRTTEGWVGRGAEAEGNRGSRWIGWHFSANSMSP